METRLWNISDRFAIWSIRAVSSRNPVWKLANCTKSAEDDLRRLFFSRAKQMSDIDNNKYSSKYPPWKQPMYEYDKKSPQALQYLKATFHVASQGEWQLDYAISGELRQYYSTTQGTFLRFYWASISCIDLLGVIHREFPLTCYLWRIQRHRTSELIICAYTK